ncbi:MAG: DUF72 domain-containing protein [ANME-2 cluster archaeon]|nr:DUF72 domain-containing protein [ANME-2 cluster archaeon]MDF1531877.1 DUF72 domain-containing protein [ANME-2 cluster archaeon]
MGTIRLGCSGWDYRDWVGTLYERDEPSKLRAYTSLFNTAEINSTFYSYPKPGLVLGWTAHTPDDFIFSVKLNRLVTHDKQLDLATGVEEDVHRFCQLMEPLKRAGKLASILIQLPPGLKYSRSKVENFLAVLPHEYPFALEFRNRTWLTDDAALLLRQYNITPVMTDGPALPKTMMSSSTTAYIRWHGRGGKVWYNYHYSQRELEPWVGTIRELADDVDVLGYFNNHYHGYAPENCLDVLEMLGAATPRQKEVRQRLKSGQHVAHARDTTLSDFFEPETSFWDVEKQLLNVTDEGRIGRSRDIRDITILKDEPGLLVADVEGYSVFIDYEGSCILHDCQDWLRGIPRRRVCKHVAALLLAMPTEKGKVLLDMVKGQKWDFRPYTG